ncbi:unnamed protein product [Blepharisma stoltei]|uniref:Uncharacterized protein n=1 Tax=Blepharisma stoltei TaxID=1481888 RepID=A0AAU9ILT0_9CILI|nr:unnamed protein product [Blepharisma stoltei]
MCRLNQSCRAADGQCVCPYLCQISKIKNYSAEVPFSPQILSLFTQAMCQQAEIIVLLSNQTKITNEKLSEISNELKDLKRPSSNVSVIIPDDNSTSNEELLSVISGNTTNFRYRISLLSTIPRPVYKERAFCLVSKLVDLQGNEVTLQTPVRFKIMLFTTERPAKLLINNTSGDKVMRGTTEVEADSLITFNNVVIKEVTSHFRHGCVFLVVAPIDASFIQPLIIGNVVIKARKVINEGNPRKIPKHSEDEI